MTKNLVIVCSYCEKVKDPVTEKFIDPTTFYGYGLINGAKENISHTACIPCFELEQQKIMSYIKNKKELDKHNFQTK